MKFCLLLLTCLAFVSCKLPSQKGSDDRIYDPEKVYTLRLNPPDSASYTYEVSNHSETVMDAGGNDITNTSKTDALIRYDLFRDSSGYFRFTMKFERIGLYSKSGEQETEAQVSNGTIPFSPEEQILAALRDGKITGLLSSAGEIKEVRGYEAMTEKIQSQLREDDHTGRAIIKERWEKMAGNNLIRQNLSQLFRLFPDSAVRLGDTWKISNKQVSEFSVNMTNEFTLKTINENFAIITASGKVTNDHTTEMLPVYGHVTTSFQGGQESRFEMEARTGMLLNSEIKSDVKGTVRVMGREVPVQIKTRIKIQGKRLSP